MKLVLLFAAIMLSSLSAQTTVNHLVTPSGFTIESVSGFGYSKTTGSQSNIASMNPAAMDRFTSTSFGVSYQYESELHPGYIADIGAARYRKAVPQSAGIVFPSNDFRIGLGFSQKYNSSLLFGDLPITTTQNPDGTGQYGDVTEKSDLFRYSALFSYGFNNSFFKDDRISLGIAFNFDWLNYNFSFGKKGHEPDRLLRSHGSEITYSLGITYSVFNKSLFSLLYERGAEFDYMITDEIIDRTQYFLPKDDRAVSKTPDRIHLGFDYLFAGKSQLTTTLSYLLWNEIEKNKKDQFEAAASYIYPVRDDLMASLGMFYTDIRYNNNFYLFSNDDFRAIYMTLGAVYSISLIDLDLTVADSHLLSGKYRKQTLLKLSAGFHL